MILVGIDEFKILVRQRRSLKKQLNRPSNQLKAYIDQAFPEYHKIFKKTLSNTSLRFLFSYDLLSVKQSVQTIRNIEFEGSILIHC